MEDGASKARFPSVDSSCRPCLFDRASWPQAAISVCRCGSVARMPMRHGSKFGQHERPVHSCVCNGHTMASFSRPFPCTIHACSCGMYRTSGFTWSASCVIHAPCIRFTGDVRNCLMIVVHLRSSSLQRMPQRSFMPLCRPSSLSGTGRRWMHLAMRTTCPWPSVSFRSCIAMDTTRLWPCDTIFNFSNSRSSWL